MSGFVFEDPPSGNRDKWVDRLDGWSFHHGGRTVGCATFVRYDGPDNAD